MNFLGIVKGIASNIGTVAAVAEPVVSIFNPALGSIIGRVSGMVVNAEAKVPGDGQGPQKHEMVVAGFNDQFKLAQDFLKISGRQMTYDADALNTAIKADVARMNAYAALSKSVKIIDI